MRVNNAFNQLTGSRQRVGNWAGVTVERKVGRFTTKNHKIELVDLPALILFNNNFRTDLSWMSKLLVTSS